MKLGLRKAFLAVSISLITGLPGLSQETNAFHPMHAWPFSETGVDGLDSLGIRGVASKMGDVQVTEMAALKANPGNFHYDPQPYNWIELKRSDGQWERGPVDLEISRTDPSSRLKEWVCGWASGVSGHGSYVGYRLYVKGAFFAEEYFPENPEPPSFQIKELSPDHVSLDLSLNLGGAVRVEGLDCNYDWRSVWIPVRITDYQNIPLETKRVHPYPTNSSSSWADITYEVTHPLLLRLTVYRDMQRYVGYYLMGKGYVSGPKEAGAEDDFVPHPKYKEPH